MDAVPYAQNLQSLRLQSYLQKFPNIFVDELKKPSDPLLRMGQKIQVELTNKIEHLTIILWLELKLMY